MSDRKEKIKSRIRDLPDNDNNKKTPGQQDKQPSATSTVQIDEFSGSMVINISVDAATLEDCDLVISRRPKKINQLPKRAPMMRLNDQSRSFSAKTPNDRIGGIDSMKPAENRDFSPVAP